MENFLENGFAIDRELISSDLLKKCQSWYDRAFTDEKAIKNHLTVNKVASFMLWPSLYVPELQEVVDVCVKRAKEIWGDDMEFDYNAIISKFHNCETPWHQDEAYLRLGLPEMPDKGLGMDFLRLLFNLLVRVRGQQALKNFNQTL